MSRTLASTIVSEVTSTSLRPILMVQFKFDSGDLNLWNGYGDLIVDSETFIGAGDLGSVSPITETQRVKATGLSFQISGLNSSIISIALDEDYQDRIVNYWLGFMDSDNIYIDRVLMFKGRLDVMNIAEAADTTSINVTAENVLISLERPNERRYTKEDQQLAYPNDLGFDQVVGLQEKEIVWGRT